MPSVEEAKAQLAKRDNAPQKQGDSVAGLIEQLKPQIERALPNTMTADRFARIVMTTLRNNPRLAQCDPRSLMSACMLSAQLGLEPGTPLGHAYFLPFKREITFVIGYRGMLDLARRSGEIESIEAREVRANDLFEFEFGLDPKLKHIPASGDRGEPTHYYGIAKFKDGGHYFEVLSKADVETYRERSRAKDDGPWVTDYSAMARKTVVRRMAPYLPLATEAARAVASDEGVVASLDDLSDDGEVGVTHDVEVVDTQRDEPEDDGPEDPDSLKKAQLVKRLHEAGLDTSGKVEELRERYRAYLEGDDSSTGEGEGEAPEPVEGQPSDDEEVHDEAGPVTPDDPSGESDGEAAAPGPEAPSSEAPPAPDEAEGEVAPPSPSGPPPGVDPETSERTKERLGWRDHAVEMEVVNQQGSPAVVPILKALRDSWDEFREGFDEDDYRQLQCPANSKTLDAMFAKYPEIVLEAINRAAGA